MRRRIPFRGCDVPVATAVEEMLASEIVDTGDIARVLQASPRSVTRWQTARSAPRRVTEERLLELKAVVGLLATVLRPEPARLWLRSPNRNLDWDKPLDLVAAGEYRRVVAEIEALAEGVTS